MFHIEDEDWWKAANERRQWLINVKHGQYVGISLTEDQKEELNLLQAVAEVIVNEEWRGIH